MLAALAGALAVVGGDALPRRAGGADRCSSRCSCRRSGFGGGGAAQPDGGGAGAAARDDGERRGADRRSRPVGQRPAAGAARPGGDPRARAGADAGAGARSRSTRRRRADLLRPGAAAPRAGAAVAAGGAVGARRLRLPPAGLVRADRRGRLCPDADASRPRARTPGGLRQLAFRIRMAASAHIQRLVPGQDGAFASAILTGDRSGIDRSVEAALRISSLYHIVSISGLHMTLLAAAVFAMIRYGLALVPRLALLWPLKKIAAGVGAGGRRRPTSSSPGCDVRGAAVLRDDGDGARRRAARPAGADHALDRRSPALIVLVLAPESLMQAGLPDVLRRDDRARRRLRGAARAGLVAGARRPRRAGASPSRCSGSR